MSLHTHLILKVGSGIAAALGVVAALYERDRSGIGRQYVYKYSPFLFLFFLKKHEQANSIPYTYLCVFVFIIHPTALM